MMPRFTVVLIILVGSATQDPVVQKSTEVQLRISTFERISSTATIIITFRNNTASTLQALNSKKFLNREQRLKTVTSALKLLAKESQHNVLQFLGVQYPYLNYSSMWISNQLVVRKATVELLNELTQFPEIEKISHEVNFYIDKPHNVVPLSKETKANVVGEVQWGVEHIEAPRVWSKGTNGSGIIIATIDTGVRHTHEALRDNHRSDYGWYDPGQRTDFPNDQNGHGTHTTANIVGTVNGIGVAPGSQWITCKGCETNACSQSDLLSCGQFIACPTDSKGDNPDCTKAPHIVSNSWGWGSGGNVIFEAVINAWRTAGIIPIFSIGNAGPFCGTAHSPGDSPNVIGVGATMGYNEVTVFSSTGPVVDGQRIKPDVAAPGYEIVSASHVSDMAYVRMSGTSMACPHVAGAVALILSSNMNLNYAQVKAILEDGSVPTQSTGRHCGGISEEMYPNHHVGFGRINVWLSYLKIKTMIANV